MALRRMFSTRITESTRFLKMPATSQNLYFHLGLSADDDGAVEAYPVMCKTGATEDDLRVLVSKEFVLVLNEDLVSFITDWREHNNIRADRKVDSIYKDLILQILPNASLLEAKESYYSRKKVCQTNDGQGTENAQANDSIGKERLSKERLSKESINTISSESDKPAPIESGILLPLMNGSAYDVPVDKIEMWQQAYLGVNVEQELRKMIAWLNSNPTRRKTARGVDKFINNWLEREQNSGRSYQNTAAREPSRPAPAQPSRNHFNNFEQRHHDYDSIVYGQIREMAQKKKEENDV